jgi:peptidoglycan/xylan/chitin deacetylase (PgdA/CDA1 family)
MYHSVGHSDLKNPVLCVSKRNFELQVRYLRRHYHVLPLDHAVNLLREGAPIPLNGVVITFDDGYRDNYEEAFPILKRYGCTATIFVSTDPLETGRWIWPTRLYFWVFATTETVLSLDGLNGPGPALDLRTTQSRRSAYWTINAHLRALPSASEREAALAEIARNLHFNPDTFPPTFTPMATWDHLREMSDGGMTIGSHAMTHPVLSLTARQEAQREVITSKAIIEQRLQRVVDVFAYPFGLAEHFDADTEWLVRTAGYRAACSAIPGTNPPGSNLYALRRLYVPDEPPSLFAYRLLQAVRPTSAGSES